MKKEELTKRTMKNTQVIDTTKIGRVKNISERNAQRSKGMEQSVTRIKDSSLSKGKRSIGKKKFF